MADGTKIEWTDATWNPITGCSVVSPGCTNCYAMKLAGTRLASHPSREGLTRDTKAGPVWTGEVRLNEEWLAQPLDWLKPRMIFVCAHGDLFAEGVPDEWIDTVFAVMAFAERHTFQVLTKRPERMRAYIQSRAAERPWNHPAGFAKWMIGPAGKRRYFSVTPAPAWPLPNVWLGVSVESQKVARDRILPLLYTPAAVRWISAEPLLSALDLTNVTGGTASSSALAHNALTGEIYRPGAGIYARGARLDWVVAGGESGADARPMHPDWPRSLRDQCAATGTAFLFKQWGVWAPGDHPRRYEGFAKHLSSDGDWIDGIAERGNTVYRVGKQAAGRVLDGREHNDYPRAA